MGILRNGIEIERDSDILLEKWKLSSIEGNGEPVEPGYCVFNNTAYALDLLRKHIVSNSKIVFHTDVDMDGIGTTYIMKKALEYLGSSNHILLINKNKEHGIQKKHADYFNKNKVDLMIITDSSSNEIETIKSFECDVLCIDHHALLHNDLLGFCNDGVHRYVIVNNTIDNYNFEFDKLWLEKNKKDAFENLEPYQGIQDMSCGLVVYELLRLYCVCYGDKKLLENLMLYQWVGVTLFTDSVNTLNERNQWYVTKTVFSSEIESTLKIILNILNKYCKTINKSYIDYTFAPLINKAIRADKGSEALDIIINEPKRILDLMQYAKIQNEVVDKAYYVTDDSGLKKTAREFIGESISFDVSALGINKNYTGVIASRLSGENHKNVAAYIVDENGLCKGSFRGKYKGIDYRKYFEDFDSTIFAQGHPGAFGFKLTKKQLDTLMTGISSIEPVEDPKPWLTIGNIKPEEYGVYHVNDIEEFKRDGYVWRIGVGNAKVNSMDEIVIRVSAKDVTLKKTEGKVYIYDACGFECKSFKPLAGNYFDIYIECTNELNLFIR